MTRGALLLGLLVLVDVSAAASTASAQTANEIALARRQFREGLDAVERGDWEAARAAFKRSLELAPRPITLLNLAGALVQTGHFVEAMEAYRMFLRDESRVALRHRPEAEAAMAELEPRLAYVLLRIRGFEVDYTLKLDDFDLAPAALDEELPLDPGEHVIVVERPGLDPVRRRFTIEEGEHLQIRMDARRPPGFVPPPPPGTVVVAPPVFESPWFWGIAGAILLIGGTTISVVALSGDRDVTAGNIPPGTVAIP